MAEIPKKISELPKISNISEDDLLLVSDYDNGKCLSRRMTLQQLVEFISQKILQSPVLTRLIQQKATATATSTAQSVATSVANNVAADVAASEAQTAATAAVDDIVKNEIQAKIMQVIDENPEEIFDMIDNKRDQQMYINAGGA